MKGILDGFGWTGLIEKGAGLLGFELPDVVSTGLDIGREFFGGGGKGSGGIDTSNRYKRAVDLGASSITGTLAVSDGGTGSTGASGARTNLGLVIGTDVEPHSDKLTELATMAQNTASSLADLTNTEVQILDGATVTTAELNIMDGNTSATSTTLAAADRLVMNDAGTMKQVALSDLVTFLENESVSSFNIDGGSY